MEELFVDNGDIRLRVEVTGDGPVVLCVPGWPELAQSWPGRVPRFTLRPAAPCTSFLTLVSGTVPA
jgi:hypothetical protein